MRALPTLAPLALLAIVVAGCGLTIDVPEIVENRCVADSDCPGAACDVTLAMCVSPGAPPLRIGLEITPAADPGLTATTTFSFETFDVVAPVSHDVALPTSITVGGDVRAPGYGEPVSATVRFI